MSWTPLKENYTDAVWSGLRKYNLIENSDNTISLQDVTVYSQKENSFYGALDANRTNAAINIIMAMLENGTDLYTNFQLLISTIPFSGIVLIRSCPGLTLTSMNLKARLILKLTTC